MRRIGDGDRRGGDAGAADLSGYTPLFSSLTTGTLCGRWPDIGLWPIVLSLADRHGIVDVTPQYIAGVTGLPSNDVAACMSRFCEPDAYSRSAAQSGARLTLLDEHRDWGWQVVNHRMYREKARKSAFDSARAADGRNAERMHDRDQTRADPRPPALTRPQTQTETKTKTQDRNPPTPKGAERPAGLDLQAWERWEAYRRATRKPIKEASVEAAMRKLAAFGAEQSVVVENSIANGYQGLIEPKSNGRASLAKPERTGAWMNLTENPDAS